MRINLTDEYIPQVLIVANGKVHRDRSTHTLMRVAEHIIVCDGALERYLDLTTRKPDVVIGDRDSVSEEELVRHGLEYIYVADQETNDLTKAVDYALSRGWSSIAIIGAAGKREDHTIGNLFLLPEYLQKGATVRSYSKHGVMLPFQGELTLELQQGHGISLFALEQKPASLKGVMYPFENRVFTALWQATLNRVTEPLVEAYSEGPALIYVSIERRAT